MLLRISNFKVPQGSNLDPLLLIAEGIKTEYLFDYAKFLVRVSSVDECLLLLTLCRYPLGLGPFYFITT